MQPCLICRGDEFRSTFAEIGSVRSLILKSVQILALTATATKETLESVITRLSLQDPIIIGLQPDRINIKYIVKECPSVKDLCHQLGDELKSKRLLTLKLRLYCFAIRCSTVQIFMRVLSVVWERT